MRGYGYIARRPRSLRRRVSRVQFRGHRLMCPAQQNDNQREREHQPPRRGRLVTTAQTHGVLLLLRASDAAGASSPRAIETAGAPGRVTYRSLQTTRGGTDFREKCGVYACDVRSEHTCHAVSRNAKSHRGGGFRSKNFQVWGISCQRFGMSVKLPLQAALPSKASRTWVRQSDSQPSRTCCRGSYLEDHTDVQ